MPLVGALFTHVSLTLAPWPCLSGLYMLTLIIGANKVAAKGAILMRIMEFLLKFEGDTPDVRIKLRMLGKHLITTGSALEHRQTHLIMLES